VEEAAELGWSGGGKECTIGAVATGFDNMPPSSSMLDGLHAGSEVVGCWYRSRFLVFELTGSMAASAQHSGHAYHQKQQCRSCRDGRQHDAWLAGSNSQGGSR